MLLDHNAPLKAWTQAWTELEKAPDKHFLLVLASRDIVDWWTNARDAVALDYLALGWKWSPSLGRCTTPQGGWLKIVPADTSLEKLRGLRFHAIHTFGVHDLDTIGFLRGRLHPSTKEAWFKTATGRQVRQSATSGMRSNLLSDTGITREGLEAAREEMQRQLDNYDGYDPFANGYAVAPAAEAERCSLDNGAIGWAIAVGDSPGPQMIGIDTETVWSGKEQSDWVSRVLGLIRCTPKADNVFQGLLSIAEHLHKVYLTKKWDDKKDTLAFIEKQRADAEREYQALLTRWSEWD